MSEITICAHTIEYWYENQAGIAFRGDMPESDIEHVQKCLLHNYVEGDLHTTAFSPYEMEINGWWKIKK